MDELIKGDAGKNVPKGDSTFMDMHSSMSKSNIFSNSIEFIRSKFYRSLTLKKLAIRYLDSTAGIKYLEESASKMGVSVKRLASAYHKTGGLGVYGEARFLNAIGGFDAIVPTEGLVFKYNGNIYKFTGAFAPINQITGLMFF